jgi:hypothetical protein
MTPTTNRRLSLGLAALLCGLLVPSAMAAGAKMQTFQLKCHQALNKLTLVDPTIGMFNMFDVGEATLLGRYVNQGQIQMVPVQGGGFAVLFGAGTITAANGDTIDWVMVPSDGTSTTDTINILGGTGRFEGAIGYINNFIIDMAPPGIDPETGLFTITVIHYTKGELTVPKQTEPASGVLRALKMQAHSQQVWQLDENGVPVNLISAEGWGVSTHCGLFYTAEDPTAPAPAGFVSGFMTSANGDQIFSISPADNPLDATITGGTGRFSGAAGEFTITLLSQSVSVDPVTGKMTLSFTWTASGTITY